MAITPAINITNVSKGMNSLNTGLGNLKKSSDTIKTVTLNRTKIKKESFARDRVLTNMREEAVRRKDQESIIESSGIGGAFKRTASVIGDSTKGFLGRILDFASSLLIGWLLYNLPTIMTAIEDLIIRIKSLYGLLSNFMLNIKNTFENFGNLLSGVYYNISNFDFTDDSGRVQSAMDDLNTNLEVMQDQFMQGFDILNKPLGEGPGEEPIPPLNTDFTQPGPTTGEGYATAGLSGPSKQIIGNDTAFLAEVKRVSQKYEVKESDLLGLIASESRFDPAAGQIGDHVGLIQFGVSEARSVGTTQDALKKMSRAEQMKYVDKYFETRNLKKGAGAGQLYATVFAPAYASGDANKVLYSSPSREYASNAPLDANRDGKITIAEMGGRIEQKKKEFGISDNVSIIPTGKSTQLPPKPTGVSGISQGSLPPLPPTDTLSGGVQRYGASRDRGARKHAGVDFDIRGPNAKFYSRIGGVVTGGQFRYGDDGWATDIYNKELGVYERIAEAAKIVVKPGQTIKPGDLVAVGESNTGVIHYEIRKKIQGGFENTVDPIAFLKNQKPQIAQVSPPPTPSAQVTPPKPPGQNVPSVAQDRRGQQIMVVDDRQPSAPQQVSVGGGSQPQMIPTESSLNSLIKNQILLELAYT